MTKNINFNYNLIFLVKTLNIRILKRFYFNYIEIGLLLKIEKLDFSKILNLFKFLIDFLNTI